MSRQVSPSVLHITDGDRKFIPQLIDFFERNFEPGAHEFVVMSRDEGRRLEGHRFVHVKDVRAVRRLGVDAREVDTVILHGLLDFYAVVALKRSGIDLSKCRWGIWGGDLYCHSERAWSLRTLYRNWVRRSVVRRLGHALTFIEGDVELARKWFGFQGKYQECLLYLSNTVRPQVEVRQDPCREVPGWNVIVGNSGYATNCHFAIFDRLCEQVGDWLGQVYCPLSYGNKSYIEEVVAKGNACFGERFTPLLDFLPLDEYLGHLDKVDAAVYAHKRQQAMGNTIALLGMGKKVFLHSDVPQWSTFTRLGIKVYDCTRLSPEAMPASVLEQNIRVTSEYFSEANLVRQYESIFAG